MALQDDLRAALDRAGDAEERAAMAEMALREMKDRLAVLEKTVADALTQEAENAGLYREGPSAESLMKTACEVRDVAIKNEVELRKHLRAFSKTKGPQYCGADDKNDFLIKTYAILKDFR